METVIQFSRHASVDTTDVLSSYFTTVGMHRFACSTVGTYFSEWIQIFQKNLFQEEPILGGSKLNVTGYFSKTERRFQKKNAPSGPQVR